MAPKTNALLKWGTKFFGKDMVEEAYVDWFLYRRLSEEEKEEVKKHLDKNAWHSGQGNVFRNRAVSRDSLSYTLITVRGGWDV